LDGIFATKKTKKIKEKFKPPNSWLSRLLQRIFHLIWALYSAHTAKNLLFSMNYNAYKNTLKLLDKEALMYYNYCGQPRKENKDFYEPGTLHD
jgi:hypothetical protein